MTSHNVTFTDTILSIGSVNMFLLLDCIISVCQIKKDANTVKFYQFDGIGIYISAFMFKLLFSYEPRHEKTCFMQKQRCRSAVRVLCGYCAADQRLCFCYTDT